MSQTGLKTRINIITTPYSIIHKSVKYVQKRKMTLFFQNWSLTSGTDVFHISEVLILLTILIRSLIRYFSFSRIVVEEYSGH